MSPQEDSGPFKFPLSTNRIVFLTFLAVGSFFLVTGHWGHLAGYLPLLLLLALWAGMHFFMHGSHGHGPSGEGDSRESGGTAEGKGKNHA